MLRHLVGANLDAPGVSSLRTFIGLLEPVKHYQPRRAAALGQPARPAHRPRGRRAAGERGLAGIRGLGGPDALRAGRHRPRAGRLRRRTAWTRGARPEGRSPTGCAVTYPRSGRRSPRRARWPAPAPWAPRPPGRSPRAVPIEDARLSADLSALDRAARAERVGHRAAGPGAPSACSSRRPRAGRAGQGSPDDAWRALVLSTAFPRAARGRAPDRPPNPCSHTPTDAQSAAVRARRRQDRATTASSCSSPGLGGLLYGVDVGIIAGALPYLEATSGPQRGPAVVRRRRRAPRERHLHAVRGRARRLDGPQAAHDRRAALLFVASIPVIALSHGYGHLVFGRLLQGVSARADRRGRPPLPGRVPGRVEPGQGHRDIPVAADARHRRRGGRSGCTSAIRVAEVAKLGDAARLLAFKDSAWRSIFWVSLPPGVLFVLGSLVVAESPRWLHRRGRIEDARAALLRSRSEAEADARDGRDGRGRRGREGEGHAAAGAPRESLLSRKYVIPFVLACVILACNQATGDQLHHRLQRRTSSCRPASRTSRPTGATCRPDPRQLPADDGRRPARRPAGPQVPAHGRQLPASSPRSSPWACSSARTERLRVDCREAVQAIGAARTRGSASSFDARRGVAPPCSAGRRGRGGLIGRPADA